MFANKSKIINVWFLVCNIVFYCVCEKINYTLLKNIDHTKANIKAIYPEQNKTIFLYNPSNIESTKSILEQLTKINPNKAFITNLNLLNSRGIVEVTLKAQDIKNLYSYLNELSTNMKGIFAITHLTINSNDEHFSSKENIRKNQEEEEEDVPFILKYLNKQTAQQKKKKKTTNTEKVNIKEYNYEAIITLGDFK